MNDPHLAGIQASLLEKDNKLKQLKEQLSSLTEEFESNWNQIAEKDNQIEQLKNQIASAKAEFETQQAAVESSNYLLKQASERLTNLTSKVTSIQDNMHNLQMEINKYDFQIKKLNETPLPTAVIPIQDDELTELQEQVKDAESRFYQVKALVQQVGQECKNQILRLNEEIRAETDEINCEYAALQQKNTELTQSIKEVENARKIELARIDAEREQLEKSKIPTEQYENQIAQLKKEIHELDLHIMDLETKIENEQKAEKVRQETAEKLQQQIDEKRKLSAESIKNSKNILATQNKELHKLKSLIEKQNETNERLKAELDALQRGEAQKPDFDLIFEQDKNEIQRRFEAAMRKEMKAQEKIGAQQREIDAQIQKKKQTINQYNQVISDCLQEARKMAQTAHERRQKCKILSAQLKQLQGEYEALQAKANQNMPSQPANSKAPSSPVIKLPAPKSPPRKSEQKKPPKRPVDLSEVEQLSNELDKYGKELSAAEEEMKQLKNEEESIYKEIVRLKKENAELEQGLERYDEVFQYHKILKQESASAVSNDKTSKSTSGKRK
ncbi:hypothetical protein TVAG_043840 [Trichomonas vaginalis G3]|uniref:Uncharacterized protein n=1 Tax=Trichomonas vaginalis (strain ATCC PRA-98 / G3) TaxID=412133 RepID=A2E0E4_TRIV3|nr:hypothetical protein TVAGG3_0540890 [Trichomonas vaginalis G3]EAY13824.1 hypothetical protein TVAG_043840 [Trichomonas vaginalis G3]KAI5519829.1 hypothetical protein TVAGG3_0540890 [Trichomonas vaginalis G3]|eukprot:XP_001326047.1 hypothetical protein [Trichomonas vaginalis G3]